MAIDTETGVGAQGKTREEVLAELDDAVALREGDADDRVQSEEVVLRDLGIDPDEVAPTKTLPEFLRPE